MNQPETGWKFLSQCFKRCPENDTMLIPVLINEELLCLWLLIKQFFNNRKDGADTAARCKMKNRSACGLMAADREAAGRGDSRDMITRFVMINDMPAHFSVNLTFDHNKRMFVNSGC